MTTSQPFERRYDTVSASKNLCVTTTLRVLEPLTSSSGKTTGFATQKVKTGTIMHERQS